MSQKNVTAITRGSMLAKQQMVEQREGKPPTLAALLNGNRAQRRAAEKQMRRGRK
jgi:hypothetical protein